MTSVTKSEDPSVTRGKKNEDDELSDRPIVVISPPLVEPCCRLPREPREIVQNVSSSSKKISSLSSSSSSFSSSTKIEESSKLEASLMSKGRKIVVEESVIVKKKSMEKSENRKENLDDDDDDDDDVREVSMVETPPIAGVKFKGIPIVEKSSANAYNPSNVAVPRIGSSRRAPPNLNERPLILATHLVPSLPIALFEILAEVIEVVTGKAVNLLYESRVDRPVAKDLVDIAILPASDDWTDGSLLPVSFVFEHRLNKEKNPAVYVDIVVAPDCIRNVEEVIDLRGYRCALPDRRKALGAAGLLFSHLKSKGENPSFFGNTLDSGSQVAALQMVAGKQAEVGVLESPVINYHRSTLPGVDSLYILASLGPLPPYRIMINKKLEASIREKIKESLLSIERDKAWMERLRPFGIIAFAEYSEDRYDLEDVKSVVTSVPYY